MFRLGRMVTIAYVSLFLILVVSIILNIFLVSAITSVEQNVWSGHDLVVVKPGEIDSVDYKLFLEEGVLNLDLKVYGGEGVEFYIEDSSGLKVFGPETIGGSYNVSLRINRSGIYRFVFKNPVEDVHTKHVHIDYYLDHRSSTSYQALRATLYTLLVLQVIGLAVLIWVVVKIAGYVLERREIRIAPH